MIKKLLTTAALTAMMAVSAFAADDKPAIVFDIGGKFDKSFNESMFNGSEKFKAESGTANSRSPMRPSANRPSATLPTRAIARSSLRALPRPLPLKRLPRNIPT